MTSSGEQAHREVVAPPTGHAAQSRDPWRGEVWHEYPSASRDVVREAVARARAAQPDWSAQPLSRRLRTIDRFHALLFSRRQDIARLIGRETGKPIPEALIAEVVVTLDLARFITRAASGVAAGEKWFTPMGLALWRKRVRVDAEPYGVIGVIAPWNYPFMLPAGTMLASLAMGNAVVVKPSEITPSCAAAVADLLHQAGIPRDVCAVVHGDGATGEALIDAGIDKLFFTGSEATGRRVAAACGERLIPCQLELGGSDAAVVLADADIAHAASGILWGRFTNCGQTCVAPKRVFVEAPAWERFVAQLSDRVIHLRIGPYDADVDVGAVIRPEQRERIASQVDEARQHQARVVAAGTPDGAPPGHYPPTLILDAPDAARVFAEETFGPALALARVADANEAVARANATQVGLSGSVWSRNRRRALAVARQLRAGTVMINDAVAVVGMADVPHGGVGASGWGRVHGRIGLEEMIRTKSIVDDRFAAWRQPWWFGYSSRLLHDVDGYARVAHGRTLRERISGILPMLRLVFRPERPL